MTLADGGEAALGEAYASLMQSISRSKASHRSSAALLSGRLHSAEEETLQAACPSANAGPKHKVIPPHEGTLRALSPEPTPVSLRSSSGHGADPSPAATVLDEPEELPPPPAALAPLLLAKGKDAQRRGDARDEASSDENIGGENGVCDICGAAPSKAVRDFARAAVLDGHDVSWRDAAPNYILSPGRPAGRTVAAKNTRGSATCPRCRDLAEMRASRRPSMHRQDKQEAPSEGPSIAERRAERKARQARAAAEVAAREEQERKVRHTLLPCSAELLES